MSQTQFNLTKFAAKYWLETTIGAIAILVLLVGIIVSQTNRQDTKGPATADSADAGTTTPAVLAVLPGAAIVTLDALRFNDKKQPFHYQKDAKVTLTNGQALEIAGWAIDPSTQTAPSTVFVQVDGFARAQGLMGDRPDVATALKNPQYQKSGFGITIPPALLAPGTHHLAFLVEDAKKTGYYVNPDWLTVVVAPRHLVAAQARQLPGTTNLSLDKVFVGNGTSVDMSQSPGARNPARRRIGHAARVGARRSSNGLAGGVNAVIDGQKDIAGAYGLARPDVGSAFGSQLLAPSGFTVTIPAGSLSKGVHQVSLRIFNSDGSGYYLLRDKVQLTVD